MNLKAHVARKKYCFKTTDFLRPQPVTYTVNLGISQIRYPIVVTADR